MELNKSKLYSSLKVYAMILVVVAHVTRMYTGLGVVTPCVHSNLLAKLTEFIYSFHMPLFICISGMVYGYCIEHGKYKDSKKFILNKAKRLLIPYIIIGCAIVAPVMVGFKFTDIGFGKYFVRDILLGGDSRHLWYLLVLFEIFLCCAVIRKINFKANYFIAFIILLAIAYIPSLVSIPNFFSISLFLYYGLFFFIGMIIDKTIVNIYKKIKNKIWILILMILTMLVLFKAGKWFFKIPVAILGILIFTWIIALIDEHIEIIKETKIYKLLDKNGFGIYLFHPMIIYILFYYLGNYRINPILLSLFIVIVTYIISILLTTIVRKIKLQFIIGEK